jgi:recombination protein RecT
MKMANEVEKKQAMVTVTQLSENIVAIVLNEIGLKEKNGLVLPDGYLAENAVMSAMFQIRNTVDTNKKPVLETCKQNSIKQAIWEMVSKGLDPNKKHCYWIAYGDQLTMTESYFGLVFRAKRADKNIKDIFAEVVYEKDTFEYTIARGSKKVTTHLQSPDNIDMTKIKGAYATILYKDGTETSEYMTISQIKTSWSKSKTGGGVHKEFPDMMAKRTVLKRLANITLNTDTNVPLLNEQYSDDFDQEAELHEATELLDITPVEQTVTIAPVESNQGTVQQVVAQELQQESFDNESLDDLPPMFQ